MHAPTPGQAGFKRQVVFRIGQDDWPLLEAAAREHGSIQAAILAGIRALNPAAPPDSEAVIETAAAEADERTPVPAARKPADNARRARSKAPAATKPAPAAPEEEISAREAAQLLGLKTSTIAGYIRSSRLPGRYDSAPSWRGWLTTRGALEAYRRRTRG